MKRVTMAGNRARWIGGLLTAIALATAGCGSVASSTREGSLPPGVMSAAWVCRQVIQRAGREFFTRVERVHLVLATYAKGEPVESRGDIGTGMPPGGP